MPINSAPIVSKKASPKEKQGKASNWPLRKPHASNIPPSRIPMACSPTWAAFLLHACDRQALNMAQAAQCCCVPQPSRGTSAASSYSPAPRLTPSWAWQQLKATHNEKHEKPCERIDGYLGLEAGAGGQPLAQDSILKVTPQHPLFP